MSIGTDDAPRISLIIPTKNRREGLEAVLKAVLSDKRDYPNLEIIVVDGNSTDGTADVIREYSDEIVFCAQKSKGLYAALNDGLRLATGDWVRMVSDDDGYVTGCLPYFAENMGKNSSYVAIGGTATYVRVAADGTEISMDNGSRTGEISIDTYVHNESLVQCIHEALFFRRDALELLGGWSESYAVSGDLDLIFRLLSHGNKILILPRTVVHARRGTDSLSRRRSTRAWVEPLVSLLLSGHWRVLATRLWRMLMHRLGGF